MIKIGVKGANHYNSQSRIERHCHSCTFRPLGPGGLEMAPSHKDKAPSHGNLTIIAEDFPGSMANANEHFPWNSPHFYALLRRLIGSVPEYRHESYWNLWDELERVAVRMVRYSSSRCHLKLMVSFTDKLSQLFKGPRLGPSMPESSTPTPSNELLVADFIGFMLETIKELNLCNSTGLIVPVKKEIEILEKQLKFLFIFLDNTPRQCNKIDGLENLLPEINDVANQAGSFLYSFFTTDGAKEARIDLGLEDLSRKIEFVNAKIKRHCLALVSKLPSRVSPSSPAVVSPFVFHFLVEDLQDVLHRKADMIHVDVKDQITTLCEGLMSLRSFIMEVESAGQQGGHGELEKLVTKIRGVAYDAGNIINLFVIGGASTWSLTVELSNAIINANNRIKLITTELVEINKSYDIGVKRFAEDPGELVPSLIKRHPLVDDVIVGFQVEAIEILKQLVGGPEDLQIISIFGMPGLGKTTLANKLYNDPIVVYHFDRRAWCVISQTYKRRSLLIGILSSVSELESEKIMKMEDESLAEELYKCLKGRRYFIIMDDIWDVNAWDDLRRSFPDDGNGSRILFTSRRNDVASQASANSSIHALPFLSEGQCWELLKRKVFAKEECLPELVDIGMEIAARCQGLPLSVVVIAALLAKMEKKASLWKEVAGSMTSLISEDPMQSLNIMELSYKHLPEHLKLCFLYFGAFPEDTEIPVRKLISHWIAEGFIRKEEKKSLEDLGQEYLMELIDRSLIIVAKRKYDGGVKACSIHDLLHDFCLRMAEKEKFLDLIGKEFSVSSSLNSTSRRLLFGLCVRSLLGFSPNNSFVIFASLKPLRVLQLSEQSDLQGIGLLIHLSYLEVEYLPTSIGCLVNLQVLVVRRGGRISEALLKMPKLQYVHFPSRIQFSYSLYDQTTKNKGFQNNKIQSISFLRINHGRDDRILKNFPNLRRLKCSFIVSKDSSQNRCFYPVIDFLTQLESLNISLEGQVNWLSDVLSFPLNLKKLTLSRFKLSWKEVSIIGRLPKLEVLKLLKVSMEGKQWNTSDGEFEQLRFLKLDNLQIAQWNASNEHFPKLVQLVLRNCTFLEEIPSSLGDIATLQMIQVELCCKSVAESAKKIQEEQQDMGNEELKVIISR
ncbi:hypothetical protein Pfo_008305 [Paulownia fortunei]|nr:hypothetical protein Pfo_008305 [Paulownia fortunei]